MRRGRGRERELLLKGVSVDELIKQDGGNGGHALKDAAPEVNE